MAEALLQASKLSKSFGGVRAVQDVSCAIPQHSIYGVIGPNGAGKTTLFNIITGFYPADTGSLIFNGQHILNASPDRIVQAGIARTFQNIRLFKQMSVLDNVLAGQHTQSHAGVIGAVLRDPRTRAEEQRLRDEAQRLLTYVGLSGYHHKLASELSYGDQRRLEIARALGTKPLLLALDEPAAGMNPVETQQLLTLLEALRSDGLTLLLIEHDMKFMMNICDTILVLNHGERIAEGIPAAIQKHQSVIDAYLGVNV